MAFRHSIGALSGVMVVCASLSGGSVFAAPGDFNYMATLSQGAGSTNTITSTQINTSDTNNYFSYTNGQNTAVNNGAGIGTGIVLTNYTTVAPDAASGLASNFIDSIALTDIATGNTVIQNLTGSYSGQAGNNNTLLLQSYNQTSLTFVFSDGTYTVGSFVLATPGNPVAAGQTPNSGTTSARVTFVAAAGAPEPSALMLAVPGVIGMVGFARRRKSSR